MEIGQYVRTLEGKIGQYVCDTDGLSLVTNGINYNYALQYGNYSDDIIDLVEAGDYVNGYKVIYVDRGCSYEQKFIVCERDDEPIAFINTNIKTVLTHEEYERVCFKVSDER